MNEQSLNNIKNAINELENELKVLKNIPRKIISIEEEITVVEEEIIELESKKYLYSQSLVWFLYKYRKNLLSKLRDLENRFEALKSLNAIDEISRKEEKINDLLNSIKLFEKKEIISDKTSLTSSSNLESKFLEWGDINFFDGYVEIKINQHYRKFRVEQSKRYLEKIKHYYSFKNVPKLKIIISAVEIKEIKNIEVLFYHIDFLTIVGHSFKTESFDISKLKKYTRTYFKLHLSFVFANESLKFLCEICDENFPIIPMPEVIINNNKTKVIHDSFLFKCGNKLIWESLETSKASYVFEVENFDESAQQLFDYIANESNSNKRQTLIRSYELKRSLKFYNRIYHNELFEWKNEIIRNIQL